VTADNCFAAMIPFKFLQHLYIDENYTLGYHLVKTA